MGQRQERRRRVDLDAQFLGQFAFQRVLGRFIFLTLAAGKLPGPGQMLALGALAQ